ncbi:hypothetical protein WAE61_01850 [Comamonadaceae bacterium PP-2]
MTKLLNHAFNALLVAVFTAAVTATGWDPGPPESQALQDVAAEVAALERMP